MRSFSARETEWLQELDGIELAGFWPGAFAFVIDWILIGLLFTVLVVVGSRVPHIWPLRCGFAAR